MRWGDGETFDDLRGNIEINANAMVVAPTAVYAGTLDRGLAVYNPGVGPLEFFYRGIAVAQCDRGGGARRRPLYRDG